MVSIYTAKAHLVPTNAADHSENTVCFIISAMSASTAAKASAPAVATASAQVSARASDEAIDITPITSSQLLEGLEDQIRTFTSISGLRSAVNTLSNHLYQGKRMVQKNCIVGQRNIKISKSFRVNYYVRAEIFTRKDLEILMFLCPTMQLFGTILLQQQVNIWFFSLLSDNLYSLWRRTCTSHVHGARAVQTSLS